MSHIERELIKQVDDAILNASPDFLKLIQKFDNENQLSGGTFYEIYSLSNPLKPIRLNNLVI